MASGHSNKSEEAKNDGRDTFVNRDILQAECRNKNLVDIGYYEPGFRDPENQQSQLMDVLLSGDESRVKAEYTKRKLRWLSQKPDGSNYYDSTIAHLMAQVLHSHERLAEARRQIDFLEDFIASGHSKPSSAQSSAEAMIKETDEVLKKAKDWKIRPCYKPRFETLTQHIEKSKEKLEALVYQLRGSKKRSFEEMRNTELSDTVQEELHKRPKRH